MPRKKPVVVAHKSPAVVQIDRIFLHQIELGVLLREIANRGWKITVEQVTTHKAG